MRSHKGIMEAISMNRKINHSGSESKEDFKLPPANKYAANRKQVKVKRQSTKGDSSRLGSKNSDRMGGFIRGDSIGSKKANNDYENIPGGHLEPLPKKLSQPDLNDEMDTSGLTEKQELSLLKNKIMDQRKELENRNEVLQALQRNFEALSMFCKKERAENQSLKSMNEKLKEEIRKYIEKITGMDNKIKTISADNELLAKDRVRAKKLAEELHEMKIQMKMLEKHLENSKNQSKRIGDSNEKVKNDLQRLKQDYKIECEKTKSLSQKLRDEEGKITETNKKHNQELMALRDEHKKAMDSLKENMNRLKGSSAKEQGELMDELQSNRIKIRDLEKIILDLKKEGQTKDVLLKSEKTKSDALTTQISDLQRSLKSGTLDSDAEKKELLEKIHDLTMSKDVLKAQYSELNSRLSELSSQNLSKEDQASKHIQDLNSTIKNLEGKIKEIEGEKEELEGKVKILEQKIFSINCDNENYVKELRRTHEDQIQVKESRIDELKMELRMMGQKLSNSGKETNSKEREARDKENEITKLKQEIEALTERIRVMLAEMDKKQSEVEKMEREIAEREKGFDQKLEEKEKKFKEYDNKIDELNGHIKDLNNQILEFTKGKDAVKQFQYEITMLKKSHDDEIQKLKATIEKEVRAKMTIEKKHKDEISGFEKQISDLNKDIRSKLESIEKLQRELKSNRSVSDLFKADIENQKEAIKQLNEENGTLQSENDLLSSDIAKLRSKLGNIPDVDLEEIALKEKIAKMKEAKVKKLIDKIDNVMSSMETNMCCYLCMDVFSEGQTITPCGHNFCKKCLDDNKPDKCPKCDDKITSTIPDVVINDVVAKYLFQRDILSSFKNEDVWKNMAQETK